MTNMQTTTLSGEDAVATLRPLLWPHDQIGFFVNPGNAGDALIAAGAWRLLDLIGVSARIVRPDAACRPRAFIYPGGGNLIPRYQNARKTIEQCLGGSFDCFVLLPHTIRGNEDLLARMDGRCHIFCRDLLSLEHVRRHAPQAHAYLADDLAFLLDVAGLMSPLSRAGRLLRLLRSPRAVRRYARWRAGITEIRPAAGRLTLMRVDVEAPSGACADPRMDLSARYGSSFPLREEAELVSGDFLRVLTRAEVVETDRLHVAIGASLMRRRVLLHDNDYGKNSAVFGLSMQGRFADTVLAGAANSSAPA